MASRILSFPALLAAVLATCVYLFVPRAMIDPDIWWHLRNAQYQLQSRSFIRRDMYSFTAAGAPWINHEWLGELPFYLGWHWLGSRGLFLVTVGALECIFLGIFYLGYLHSRSFKAALLVSFVAAFLSTISFGPRTLLFGWIGLVAELLILTRFLPRPTVSRPLRVQRQAVWMLPALFILWVNTHGSWIIGIVVLLAFVLCGWPRMRWGVIESSGWSKEQRRILVRATALSLGVLMVNPYGWRLVAYPFDLAFRQKLNIANVEEWATLDFHSLRGHVLLASLTLVFLSQLVRRRSWAPYELAFVAIAVYASFTYSRFLFLAAILIFPLFAKEIHGFPPYRAEKNKPWLNAAILCVLAGFVVYRFPSRDQQAPAQSPPFPDKMLAALNGFHPQGRVFNDYMWGGFLEWHTRQIPVFIDSRVDIFEYNGALEDYLNIVRLKDSLAILDRYKIRYVLFEQDTALVYFLRQRADWKVDYEDGSTTLLERVLKDRTRGRR